MRAIQLTGFDGYDSLVLGEVERPRPREHEVLIQVKAAGLNFADLELARGRYPAPRPIPFVVGFEAAGTIVEVGAAVTSHRAGDRVAALVSTGGFAEYAVAAAAAAIPIPAGITFAEASTLTIQGLSAYALLALAARPQAHETLLVQAAAGGVGLFLVQLARHLGAGRVIALAGSAEKLALVRGLGADVAVDYTVTGWPDAVRAATGGRGVDVVLEAASGDVGDESFRLLAPFGRIVLFGAKNIHDTLAPDKVRQLITQNQSLVGFNIPSVRPETLAPLVPRLLELVVDGKVKLFADTAFPLARAGDAFRALAARRTIGKVVLVP